MKLKKESTHQIINIVLLLGYLVFNAILLSRHEPWRDEANVWLMGRELSPIQLFQEIKYQGHPCLWYLSIMPFAKAGFPLRTIEMISFLVMFVAAAIVVWKSPLHGITKAFCLFSPVFTYFYSCIARNYCLIALLLILLAWQYPKRNDRCILYGLLLGLMVQADTIAIAPAGMISLMWLCENLWSGCRTRNWEGMKKVLKGIWIPAASLLLWGAQFCQVSDSPQFTTRDLGFSELLSETQNFSYGILSRMTGLEHKFCFFFMFCCVIVLALLTVKLKNAWAAGVLLATFLFQAVFSAIVYQLHMWHYLSLCFTYIWMLWVLFYQVDGKRPDDKFCKVSLGLLEILLVFLCICMFGNWNSERESSSLESAISGLYSDGSNTAGYIRDNMDKEDLIVTTDVAMAATVVAELPQYEFYYAGNGKKETYADWTEEQSGSISLTELLAWAKEKFSDKQELYLIRTENDCLSETENLSDYEIVYQTEEKTVKGEEYTIFRIPLQ